MAGKKSCGSMPTKRMKAGGVTSMEAKKYGRNMARVRNQRRTTRGK